MGTLKSVQETAPVVGTGHRGVRNPKKKCQSPHLKYGRMIRNFTLCTQLQLHHEPGLSRVFPELQGQVEVVDGKSSRIWHTSIRGIRYEA